MVGSEHQATGSSFGQQLREWRLRQKTSLRVLAHRLHVDFGYLGKVERGNRVASREFAEACDAALDAGGALTAAWHAEHAVVHLRPAQLPSTISSLVGRHEERRRIFEHLTAGNRNGSAPAIVIDRPPGVGKTSLALHCANEVADRYPDGVLFADLRAHSDYAIADAGDVLEQFLLALGYPSASIPRTVEARASLYRSVLRRSQFLIVLDNARNSEQVRPLLPGASGCSVLVTSRVRLSGLTVRHGAAIVNLLPLHPEEAVDLLRGIVGDERVDAELDAAITLAQQCSCLPLALCVAAERIASRPKTTLADLVEDLTNETDQLGVLESAEDISLEVRRVFSWSYRSLDPEAAFLFRVLSLNWGTDISLEAAAALAGWTTDQTRRSLDVLVGTHLLQEAERRRYRFHDLLRVYAAELSRAEDDKHRRQQAVDRLLSWYLAAAHAAGFVMAPYRQRPEIAVSADDLSLPQVATWAEAVAWFERELPALITATSQALNSGVPAVAHDLPITLWDFFFLRKPWAAWISMNENGLTAARSAGNRAGEAWTLYNLGVAYLDLGEFDRAMSLFEQSLDLRRRLADRVGQGWSLLCLGNTRLARGEAHLAAELLEQALNTFVSIGDRWAVGICRGYLGGTYTVLKKFDDALTHLKESEYILRDLGDQQGEGCALDLMARLHISREEREDALDYLDKAIDLRTTIGDRRGQAGTLFTLGKLQQDGGKLADARDSFARALALFTELGDPDGMTVRKHLRTVESELAGSVTEQRRDRRRSRGSGNR